MCFVNTARFFCAVSVWCMLFLSCSAANKTGHSPKPGVEDDGQLYSTVFKRGEGGYAYFRIPAAVISPKGTILVFAEGRVDSSEDYGNIDMVLKRSEDGGKTWGDLIVVSDEGNNRCANPAPVALESGRILLLYSWSKTGEESSVDDVVYTIFSDDDGRTWGKSEDITEQIKDPGAGETNYHTGPVHGIVKTFDPNKGRIIIPVWGKTPKAFVIYSDDEGRTWKKGGAMDYRNANEATVAELGNGDIIINTRNGDKENYYRYDAISSDGGLTFGTSRKTMLIEPVNGCQGSMIRHSVDEETGETILLFSNPNHTSSRRWGAVKASFDSGDSWTKMYQYVPSEGNEMYTSYSDLVVIDKRIIGVIYEAGYKNAGGIAFKTINFSDISNPVIYE